MRARCGRLLSRDGPRKAILNLEVQILPSKPPLPTPACAQHAALGATLEAALALAGSWLQELGWHRARACLTGACLGTLRRLVLCAPASHFPLTAVFGATYELTFLASTYCRSAVPQTILNKHGPALKLARYRKQDLVDRE